MFDLIIARKIQPCLTEAVLAEYHRVFDYERLKHLDRRRIAKLHSLLDAVSIRVKASGRLKISGHEEDNRIYECAVAAKARYIVTENSKHFRQPYKNTRIVTARQLLAILELDGDLKH